MTITDLIQEGSAGLIKSVDKLDYDMLGESEDKEKTLKSFFSKRIKGSIRRAVDTNRGDIRIPEHKMNEIRKNPNDEAMVSMFFNSIFLSIDSKPYDDDDLWQAIRQALATDARQRSQGEQLAMIRDRLDSLTDKERLVLDLMIQGNANKTMANELDVSLRTIENRRRSIFTKFEANSVAELVSLVLKLKES